MDPRLDGKWNGSIDPRTALPLDPWTEARRIRRLRRNPVPYCGGLHLTAVIGLFLGIMSSLYLGHVGMSVWFSVLLLMVLVCWLRAWLIKPITG
jgi:hypothetical protein